MPNAIFLFYNNGWRDCDVIDVTHNNDNKLVM